MSFANVENQLARIVQDVSAFTDHVEQLVDWWAGMTAGLDGLKDALPQITLTGTWVTPNITRGWNEVADQFSLYAFKVS
jgi:hypothetical protein